MDVVFNEGVMNVLHSSRQQKHKRQTASLSQKVEWLAKMLYILPLPLQVQKHISSYNSTDFLREEEKKDQTVGT